MKKSRAISAIAAAVLVSGTVIPSAMTFSFTASAGEQLGQTDFDDGVGLPWHICESETGEMDFDISNGVYKITIVNPRKVGTNISINFYLIYSTLSKSAFRELIPSPFHSSLVILV